MRKLALLIGLATALSAAAPLAADAQGFNDGCYRLGFTGYHWYRFCLGPDFIYPHQRVCRNGSCWYR